MTAPVPQVGPPPPRPPPPSGGGEGGGGDTSTKTPATPPPRPPPPLWGRVRVGGRHINENSRDPPTPALPHKGGGRKTARRGSSGRCRCVGSCGACPGCAARCARRRLDDHARAAGLEGVAARP